MLARHVLAQCQYSSRVRSKRMMNQTIMFDVPDPLVVLVLLLART